MTRSAKKTVLQHTRQLNQILAMVLKPQQPSVLQADVIRFDELRGPLPFLKNIKLTMLQPRHFGLEKWTRTFIIPDNWMRKIYRHEAFYDTDIPKKEPESFTEEQRKVLYDWLRCESPFRVKQTSRHKQGRRRLNPSPSTDLVDILNMAQDSEKDSDDLVDSGADDDSDDYDERKIPLLIGHKYQPERMVVRKALQNMRLLTKEQNERINYFMSDPDLMRLLHRQVSEHLGKPSDGPSI